MDVYSVKIVDQAGEYIDLISNFKEVKDLILYMVGIVLGSVSGFVVMLIFFGRRL